MDRTVPEMGLRWGHCILDMLNCVPQTQEYEKRYQPALLLEAEAGPTHECIKVEWYHCWHWGENPPFSQLPFPSNWHNIPPTPPLVRPLMQQSGLYIRGFEYCPVACDQQDNGRLIWTEKKAPELNHWIIWFLSMVKGGFPDLAGN